MLRLLAGQRVIQEKKGSRIGFTAGEAWNGTGETQFKPRT
jgi:hypothetical protein